MTAPQRIQRQRTKGWRMPTLSTLLAYNWGYGVMEQGSFREASLPGLRGVGGCEAFSVMQRASTHESLQDQARKEQRLPAGKAGSREGGWDGGSNRTRQPGEQGAVCPAASRRTPAGTVHEAGAKLLRELRIQRRSSVGNRPQERWGFEASPLSWVRDHVSSAPALDSYGGASSRVPGALRKLQCGEAR